MTGRFMAKFMVVTYVDAENKIEAKRTARSLLKILDNVDAVEEVIIDGCYENV